jgi:hypothetical protein
MMPEMYFALRQTELLRSDARPAAHGRAGLDRAVPRAGRSAVMSRIRTLSRVRTFVATALSLTGGATAP